jgi:hypothetical protein
MNCQNCHELIEPGAAFCGNCGYPVQLPDPVPAAPADTAPEQAVQNEQLTQPPTKAIPAQPSVPSYALATPNQHTGETQAVLAVIFGVIGMIGSGFLIPVIGFVFGLAGLCMATISRRKIHRRLALVGLVFASLAIVAGFASLVYNVKYDKSSTPNAQTGQSTTGSKVSAKLSTPCYSFNLIDKYNVSNSSGSCDTTVFNGQSFSTSTDIYKIVATKGGTTAAGTFTQLAKQAINTDIKNNLPGFTVTSEGPASFAGSLAYTVYASNKGQDTAVVETGVLRQTTSGYNVFDILHAVNGSSVNLQALEAQWQWK